ncbi:MAG: AAA family ATPase [Acidimicrobiia bacterium]
MRPRLLLMEGFLAYRERTEVDFADADLFVLSGPTGSGKSSVIDAMTFALYGTIPRLDDRRSVAPVISARSDRARVSFEFSVGDDTYTAVRLVERRGSGATTPEARLQRGEEVLASGADEVTTEVTRLLGLSYDHFTKAVVLPQGAFADFLTDKPKDRQALLRALLEIGIFEEVMHLANARARTAEGRAQAIGESLAKLDVPTEEQLGEAARRLEAVVEAAEEMPARVEDLRRLETSAAEAKAAHDSMSESVARLEAIAAPKDLARLENDRISAGERLAAAETALAAIVAQAEDLDAVLSEHPSLHQLESWRSDRIRLQELIAGSSALDLDGLAAAAEEATAARGHARAGLDALRVAHAAHELREGLAIGDECPVCHGVLTALPTEPGGSHAQIELLAEELRELESAAALARDRLKEAEGQSKQIDQRVVEIEERLDGAPAHDAVDTEMTVVGELLARHVEFEAEEKATRAELEAARAVAAGVDERAALLRQALLEERDRVAAEGPPIPGDDVVEGWQAFEEWRAGQVRLRRADLEPLGKAVDDAVETISRARDELASWLRDLDVDSIGSPETDLALAIERRRSEVHELEKTVAESVALARDLEAETARSRVASALGNHLRSNNFERWLLEEALETLVEGANHLLDELTGGAYSLVARESQFEVIDHRNADLTRTTRGLSGGETFLVALSLSLSMAEQLAELTGMTSRLESILLDEGFGSLDQESLDVVGSVLDELVGRGRTVGIVTHVRELADRIPVRFEVNRGPGTASVVRTLA